MDFHPLDGIIVAGTIAAMVGIGLYARKYVKGVADFLAADRLAGKYLLTVATGGTGSIGLIAAWQMINNAGLSTQWWGMMGAPVGMIVALTGFIIYRFRQTRALTLAQFFEMRYTRRFRFFAGLLSWISGVLNYGIFPAVAGRLFMTLLGLPDHVAIGGREVGVFPLTMLAYLILAVAIACWGGMIGIIISDFYQEFVCKIILIAVTAYLLWRFNWDDIVTGLLDAPEGKSMINPFKAGRVESFSIWYFLIGVFGGVYNAKSWQSASGYNSSAKTPHDAQFAGILATWRALSYGLCILLPPLIAYAVFHNDAFADIAGPIRAQLDAIADPQVRDQMTTPTVMANVLPVGLAGGLAALFISGVISIDDTYTHAWGSIFIQDVVMPLRKKPFEPRRHLLYLRLSVVGVALFGFIFSMLFPFQDYIYMFFALTGAIYLGGAGIVIFGGLYWRRGTTAGAFAAMIVGTVLAFGGMLLEQTWASRVAPLLLAWWPDWDFVAANQGKFFLNGQVVYFIAMITATLVYVIVSLLTCKEPVNLDKLLHRGEYSDAPAGAPAPAAQEGWLAFFGRKMGLTPQFSKFERVVFWATMGWSLGWWGIFLVGTYIGLHFGISDQGWSLFWWLKIWLSMMLGIITSVWILLGGLRDAFRLFKDLKTRVVDDSDDGFVP